MKILDFGLAKALAQESCPADPASSPTLTMGATAMGVILGTAAYMSPEQASGKVVDRRADIWSLGVVLWEMLMGRRLFRGESISQMLAEVLKAEPDLSRLPARVRPIVERCLRKDPRRRWHCIGDVRLALEEDQPSAVVLQAGRSMIPLVIAGVLAIALTVTAAFLWRATRPVDRPLIRLNVDLGPDALVGSSSSAAISRDGTRLVFPMRGPDGKQQLATRLLDQITPTLLPGTDGAFDPFFSPDGQWIAFFVGGKMKKAAVQGGAPVTLCNVLNPRGGAWGPDGTIIAALNFASGLSRVPDTGGTPEALTNAAAKGDHSHRWPQILPGERALLFTAGGPNFEDARIDVLSLKTGQWKTVLRRSYFGRYVNSGHLLYVHQGTLFALPFDVVGLEARGPAAPLLQDVVSDWTYGAAQFHFSETGTFVYLSGKAGGQRSMAWLDHTGKIEPLFATPGQYLTPRLSPDGKLVAFTGAPAPPSDVWVYDWQRDIVSHLTFTGQASRLPVWTPDGKHLVFASNPPDSYVISWIRADGAGEAQRLIERKGYLVPWSFSPEGRLAFMQSSAETGMDIWTLPLDRSDPEHVKPGEPEAFLRTAANERFPAFSPDGRWIAYSSDESGNDEIYVRPFPGPGGKWQISTGGGRFLIWSRNGRELFYEAVDDRIMVAGYTATRDSFTAGKPLLWSDKQMAGTGALPNFDLAPDGKRLVVLQSAEADRQSSVHVTFLLNFFDELKRRAPVGGK